TPHHKKEDFMKIKYLFLMTTLSMNVLADPIYLDCERAGDKEVLKFSVKLDEQTNKVTHTNADGSAFNTEGFFSANSVTYQKISIMGGKLEITQMYEISRQDLSLKFQLISEPVDKAFLKDMPREV